MPKVIADAVLWIAEQHIYIRREPEGRDIALDDEEQWQGWLAGHSSISFQGRAGHLTLRKESRAGQGGYWYAYRCHNRRTIKRYAGRTAALTITHLEEIAREISNAFSALQIEAPAADPDVPLLLPKLLVPRLHRSLIVRERLLHQFDACLEHPLTILCAPAGFGKTTLVRQWIAARSTQESFPPLAWISLDTGDNDPTRFWRTLFTAAQTWYTTPDQRVLHLLLSSTLPSLQSLPLERVLTTFLNDMTRQNLSGLLILEDYHRISEASIHETLSFFLAHLPITVRVVLITRHEPPLPLARLRANGDLNEIQAADLRFSSAESASFFQDYLLSPEALQQVETRLEGWAAGLRLLALSLQGKTTQPEIEQVLSTFSGSHRPFLDYFVTEVLRSQPEPLQDFLLRTSGLPRLTSSLCVAVTGQEESASFLEHIERSHFFLEAIDSTGEWYRYHALFAEAMQYAARRRFSEDKLCVISHAASCWFEQRGLFSEAIESAFKAQESARAASLIEQLLQLPSIQENREYRTLRRWLEQLPATILHQSPMLCFAYAIALTLGNDRQTPELTQPDRLAVLLQRAEEGWQASHNLPRLSEVYAFRAFSAFGQGEQGRAAAWASQALVWLPEKEAIWRGLSLSVLAFQALQEGQLNAARHLFQQVDSLAQIEKSTSILGIAPLFLGIICFEQGQLHQAARYYRKLSQAANQQEAYPASVFAGLPMTLILYEWNELSLLQQEVQKVLAVTEQFSFIPQGLISVATEMLLACVQHAQGETKLAAQRLAALLLEQRLPDDHFSLYLSQEVLYWLVRFSLLLGDQYSAQSWLDELIRRHQQHDLSSTDVSLPRVSASLMTSEQRGVSVPLALQEQKALLMARIVLAQGEPETALSLLSTWLPEAQAAGRGRNVFQIKLLMARAYAECEQPSLAQQYLREALAQGHPAGYLRSFLDEGNWFFSLLRELLPDLQTEPLRSYARTLLRTWQQTRSAQSHTTLSLAKELVEPLSRQERHVLRLLLAEYSASEIAQELVVSVNTIRTQIQSIYRKLNVHNRKAACAVARQLHLG